MSFQLLDGDEKGKFDNLKQTARVPDQVPRPTHGICQIFYTSKIPSHIISNYSPFYPRKCVNREIYGQKLRMEDVLPIYFEQIASF